MSQDSKESSATSVGETHRRYWRSCLKTIGVLLSIWFIAGFVLPFFLVEQLNEYQIGGYKLGFWMAQQGSIIAFILLVLSYAVIADRLDKRFRLGESED